MRIWGKIEKPGVETLICSKCGRADNIHEHPYDFQEYLSWENECGYGSIFGDGARLELDLCQACVLELLGPYLEVKNI